MRTYAFETIPRPMEVARSIGVIFEYDLATGSSDDYMVDITFAFHTHRNAHRTAPLALFMTILLNDKKHDFMSSSPLPGTRRFWNVFPQSEIRLRLHR